MTEESVLIKCGRLQRAAVVVELALSHGDNNSFKHAAAVIIDTITQLVSKVEEKESGKEGRESHEQTNQGRDEATK